MTTLLELSSDIRTLEDALEQCEDEEGVAILLSAYLATEEQIAVKIDGYAGLIRELEHRADGRKAESARLSALASADANLAKTLKSRLLWWMQEQRQLKVETAHYRVSVQANGGVAPLIKPDNPFDLPERFWFIETSVRIDTQALRSALEEGEEIPGARLGERGVRLAIK